MNKIYSAVSLFLVCCFASLLTGCLQSGYLNPGNLTAIKKGDTVQLCLSVEVNCPQPEGVRLAGIAVYRYDSSYDNEIVWEAEPNNPITDERVSGVITYGVPPNNWTNKRVAPALICGKAYLVVPGDKYFALKCDGSVVVFDAQHLAEFFVPENPPGQRKNVPAIPN